MWPRMRVGPLIALGIALFTLAPAPARAQIIEPRRVFGRYQQFVWNDQHGLPQSTVNAARRTRDGYMWLGTVEGAARFDGVRFVVFNRINTPQLRNSSVNALYEDREGGLWFGTDAGVTRLKDGIFTSYTTEEGLADDHVHAITGDRHGNIWIGTFLAGVVRFKDGKFTTFGTAHGLPHEQVWSLAIGPDERLWVGTLGGRRRLRRRPFQQLHGGGRPTR
jgi:ligand-binding sensor domain-containing protein